MNKGLVYTVKNKCRVCFTCVRECPVKAIKIVNGQAEVMSDHCIVCGNCVNVCSQGAKAYKLSIDQAKELLASDKGCVAAVAPSFPAEFTTINDYRYFVAMLRKLGFKYVLEVAFGADLVAGAYKKLINNTEGKHFISSDCPAIVNFITRYHPDLVPSLAPIVSPMVAVSRVIRKKYGDVNIIFIGPCFAKKEESDELDCVLTFAELNQLFNEKQIHPEGLTPSDFDTPIAGKGAIFPVSRGLMQTIDKNDDIAGGNIIAAEGRPDFKDAVKEFENGLKNSHHLELLCCDGCIMGPGMTKGGKRYGRRSKIGDYVTQKLNTIDPGKWEQDKKAFAKVDLARSFVAKPVRIREKHEDDVKEMLWKLGKRNASDHLNCGACGYDTCYEHALAMADGIAEMEMCLPFTIEKLHKSIEKLNVSNEKLASAREALKQSEKLASMGQLSAGIAHELNNPLGVITMYSNILIDEAKQDDPVRQDLELIAEQANRCKNIVGGLLNFARKSQVNRQVTHLSAFVKHSLESVIIPSNIETEIVDNLEIENISIDNDQMIQALTNLEKNAIEAMPSGGKLKLKLYNSATEAFIEISDTGYGIKDEHLEKLFTPFFTTKPIGKGTGLGLSLIYGIIKMHKGKIEVKSNANSKKGPTGTTFTIRLPLNV